MQNYFEKQQADYKYLIPDDILGSIVQHSRNKREKEAIKKIDEGHTVPTDHIKNGYSSVENFYFQQHK
uniref:Uncharacterized protein n=1 Tax=Strigamia maritima TaxID=126957 RepID=T1IUV4_STRMM